MVGRMMILPTIDIFPTYFMEAGNLAPKGPKLYLAPQF